MDFNTWSTDLKKDLWEISDKLITSWCEVVIKMGVEDDVRSEWCNTFIEQVEGLYNDMLDDAVGEQNKLIGKIESLLKQCDRLCKDLGIKIPDFGSDQLSLTQEYIVLATKVEEYTEQVNKRKEEIISINKRQLKLCTQLGKEPKVIPESPLPTQGQLNELCDYIETLESERFARAESFLEIKSGIMTLANELDYQPKLDFEMIVLSNDDSLFAFTDSNMEGLQQFYETLLKLRRSVSEEIADLTDRMKLFWEMLNEDVKMCNDFLQKHSGCSLHNLEAIKHEVKRLDELKQSNIQKFVESYRREIEKLWDQCHYTPIQRAEFDYIHADLYTEDLLTIHDLEIQKLRQYYTENSELFTLLDRRKEMWIKLCELEERVKAPDRFKNRGGQLLKEEKERNVLSKRIPIIEAQLINLAQECEDRMERPFTSWGKTVKEIIETDHKEFEEEKLLRSSARKRDKTLTPAKSMTLFHAASAANLQTLNANTPLKRKLIGTPDGSSKKPKTLSVYKAPNSALSKVNGKIIKKSSRDSQERLRIKKKYSRLSKEFAKIQNSNHNVTSNDYDIFEKEISNKENCRSTLFGEGLLKQSSTDDIMPLPITPAKLHTPHRTQRTLQQRTPLTENKLSTATPLRLQF